MYAVAQELGQYAIHYLDFHKKRFEKFLESLLPHANPSLNNSSILELGAFFPFTSCLPALGYKYIYATDMPIWCTDNHFSINIKMINGTYSEMLVPVFNVEKDKFPYENEKFETVLCLEILEHLAFDPMHCLSEINRILVHSGKIVISTPNICSMKNVQNMLSGFSPIGNQIFVPDNLYARHNSEMSQHELRHFLKCAGFSIDILDSYDFISTYDNSFCEQFPQIDMSLRGDTLFCVASKSSNIVDRNPKRFYL